MIEGLILEMLAEATRKNRKESSSLPPYWLRQARDIIYETFNKCTGLSPIAEMVGVNPAYLARMFRRYYGCSIGNYARQLQLKHAVQQLSETNLSLPEISASAGFYDQSHFTKAFKLYLKMTPAEFRKLNK